MESRGGRALDAYGFWSWVYEDADVTFRTSKSYTISGQSGRGLWARVGACFAALILTFTAQADTIVGTPIDWDYNVPTPAWGAIVGDATVAISGPSEGNTTDWLKITLPTDKTDTVKGEAADLFAGTWQSDYWVEFDFWAQGDNPPLALEVRWADAAGDRIWGNTIESAAVGSGDWNTLRSDPFAFSASNWDLKSGTGGDAADFLADLNAIDWIGVSISTDGFDSGVYGVDDFKLMVPEPAEYLMLAAALITALLVMRRQKLLPAPLQAVTLG
jgi:hypothetical protein